MGLFDKIFGSKQDNTHVVTSLGYRTLTELNPVFTSYQGAIYEQELTRSVIQRFSDACCKLKPEVRGVESLSQENPINPSASKATGMDHIQRLVKTRPNNIMSWPTFLARVATIFEIDNSVFIVKSYKKDMTTVAGIYPLLCDFAEIVEYKGEPWIRFNFRTGDRKTVPLSDVAIVSKFQYSSDFFGETNCLNNTLQLIHAQNEAQQFAIKNGAKIRFIGKLTGQVREEDMEKKRERFMDSNFNTENTGGLILYDQTYDSVQQVTPQSYTMNAEEMELINGNIYTYFGINEDILQNKYSEDTWGAWYEGRIEPFAVKLGEALSMMFYSPTQMVHGKRIEFSSNRLAYASNASKRNMVRDMMDRGIMTINEGREVLQMPPVEDGDIRVIRGEYLNVNSVSVAINGGGRMPKNDNENDMDLGGDDQIYKESDAHNKDDF